ncbi:hypothetical protein AURDEDRAFT_115086 [Auricularia subglabra TFB-10046 SS5]|nr:hypothetical protein AURDEDRAFT_115086 [Auricularia subglabra TFB-10046 SS5]
MTAGAPGPVNPVEHCTQMVRERDYASYIAGRAIASADTRNAFYVLRAFAVELASVPEMVSNATLGKMRYQFWRDALRPDARPPQHPLAQALHPLIGHPVPAYHLKRIVDARDADLGRTSYPDTDALTTHCESTTSTLLYAQVSLLPNLPPSALDTASHVASHVGVAAGLATLLRALPFHAAQRRLVLPVDLTANHGVTHEDVFRHGGDAQGVSDAVFALATVANDHLLTARDMLTDGIPDQVAPIIAAPGVPAALYLERLEKENFNAFAPSLQARDWKLAWRMWRALRSLKI